MEPDLDIVMVTTVTRKDGRVFAEYTFRWFDLDREGLQEFQHAIVESLLALGDGKLPASPAPAPTT